MDDSKADRKNYVVWVWLAIALYSLTLCFLKCRLFQAMNMGLRDLAIFDQALWYLVNHGQLYSSLVGENILGEHTSFILYLIAPLYQLYCSPETLVCVQSFVDRPGSAAGLLYCCPDMEKPAGPDSYGHSPICCFQAPAFSTWTA